MKIPPRAFASTAISLLWAVMLAPAALAQSYVYRPTAFTQPFVSTINSQSAARAYLGITTSPGLGDTNVWTGPNTFTASKFYPQNNIGMRLLWSSPTNIFLSSVVASAALTNNGDFAASTAIATATIPALLGSNSSLAIAYGISRTNANTTAGNLLFYAGTNTNFVAQFTTFATSIGSIATAPATVFQNAASFTSQIQSAGVTQIPSVTNFVDTSSAFTFYVGAQTTTSHTNALIVGLRIYEIYAP